MSIEDRSDSNATTTELDYHQNQRPMSIEKPEAEGRLNEPPNGGMDAWLCVLGTFLSYMSTW